ncbi:MAG TPA: hypothetical protein VKM94_01485 [Blastocatellia bacterium]|nr:hypothetical protein [Blastocatellia bacterium]
MHSRELSGPVAYPFLDDARASEQLLNPARGIPNRTRGLCLD